MVNWPVLELLWDFVDDEMLTIWQSACSFCLRFWRLMSQASNMSRSTSDEIENATAAINDVHLPVEVLVNRCGASISCSIW
jgi:hypothetical protein